MIRFAPKFEMFFQYKHILFVINFFFFLNIFICGRSELQFSGIFCFLHGVLFLYIFVRIVLRVFPRFFNLVGIFFFWDFFPNIVPLLSSSHSIHITSAVKSTCCMQSYKAT